MPNRYVFIWFCWGMLMLPNLSPTLSILFTCLFSSFCPVVFSFEKHPNFKEFAIKRFKGLMVPYLWINLITYLFWLFAGRNFGEDATISTTWYSPIIGILLGYSKQMIHNTPMWFFICLYFLKYFTTSYSNRYKRKANR